MARVLVFCTLAALVFQVGARRISTRYESMPSIAAQTSNEPLCSTSIVAETCLGINGGVARKRGNNWTQTTLIRDLLAADDASMGRLWDAIRGPTDDPTSDGLGYYITCEALCNKVVEYAQQNGICPQESDKACYVDEDGEDEPDCTLDVGVTELASLGPKDNVDLPNMHDKPKLHKIANSLIDKTMKANLSADIIDYDVWETVERVANLFRVYPVRKPELDEDDEHDEDDSEDEDESSLIEASNIAFPKAGKKLHARKAAQAKAYMGIVIRAFNAKRTKRQMTKWFGRGAFSSTSTRREILRVLNSVDHMISNIRSVYPGPECEDDTYAYVYPESYTCKSRKSLKKRDCTKYKNKFVFYMCPLYLDTPDEMVETLVHEGSHHATAFTDDVDFEGDTAYGRGTCKRLAAKSPRKALNNADNFCYYIQDVAEEIANE